MKRFLVFQQFYADNNQQDEAFEAVASFDTEEEAEEFISEQPNPEMFTIEDQVLAEDDELFYDEEEAYDLEDDSDALYDDDAGSEYEH
jgi:hypothetical protein